MSQMISIVNKPKIADEVTWRRDGENDQIIILSKDEFALPLMLNPTAARIFLLCNAKNSLQDITRILCAEFWQDDFKMVLEDVSEQIEYFLDKGIVKGGE